MVRLSNVEKLKRWRAAHDESYAKVIMDPPIPSTLLRSVPFPGLVLIMGAKGMGKSALAHDIAFQLHNRRHLPSVMHLPTAPQKIITDVKRLLPDWYTVVSSTAKWPNHCVVIWDETSQGAHARRTQSNDAIELDNLMGISRQREQLIIFISHHSRKLDPNVIRDVDRIAWKSPTYAHWIFERNEFSDFVLKAIDFFKTIPSPNKAKRTTLMMDFHNFTFSEFRNDLPPYWTERLSHLFEEIRCTRG